ncbi:MAG: TA system VapC family ribonuclease toxin [Candidatus Rokuibacteriota bacterium]
MIAIDTNLLVYAHRRQLPEHGPARRAIERAAGSGAGWGIALASVAEFWSVVTHPAAPRASTAAEAAGYLAALIGDGGGELWVPRPGFGDRLLQQSQHLSVRGPRIFDLQIALTAAEHGASEVWTHDRGFVTVPGLRVRHPLVEGR